MDNGAACPVDGEGRFPVGARIFIAEDSTIIAMDLEELFRENGAVEVRTVGTVPEALAALESGAFDAAILDVELSGEMALSIGTRLTERRIPFIFATGHDATEWRRQFPDVPILPKPYTFSAILKIFGGESQPV